jgi:hypothetical protein
LPPVEHPLVDQISPQGGNVRMERSQDAVHLDLAVAVPDVEIERQGFERWGGIARYSDSR